MLSNVRFCGVTVDTEKDSLPPVTRFLDYDLSDYRAPSPGFPRYKKVECSVGALLRLCILQMELFLLRAIMVIGIFDLPKTLLLAVL